MVHLEQGTQGLRSKPLTFRPSTLRYALASHFFWGLWSILQASMSTIEFGYLVSNWTCEVCGAGRNTGHAWVPWPRVWVPVSGLCPTRRLVSSPGICPVSLPFLLRAEESAGQLPRLILTADSHLRVFLQPLGQDLGGQRAEAFWGPSGLSPSQPWALWLRH